MKKQLKNGIAPTPSGPGGSSHLELVSAEILLRSELNPAFVLGQPTVCGLVDDWGKFVYSVSSTVGIEANLAAALALELALVNKVDLCAQFGTSISQDTWPVEFLPGSIAVDHDAFLAPLAEKVAKMGIDVLPASGRCVTLRSILEQHFPVCANKIVKWLPGDAEPAAKGTGLRRPAMPVLTMRQFQELLLGAVLRHHRAILKTHRMDHELMTAGVEPRPIDLLRWGMANRTGLMRHIALADARFQLLPRGTATITAYGIRFDGLYFTSNTAMKKGWHERARCYGDWTIEVAYDPRLVNRIYAVNQLTHAILKCGLTSKDERFKGLSWAEIRVWKELQRKKWREMEFTKI